MATTKTASYPKRPAFFAHKAFRLMCKVVLAQEIGPDAMLLLAVILHQEDAKRYRGPVNFFTGQLLPLLGVHSWDRLDRARKAATDAGWLHYESRGRRPGLYWVTVPSDLEHLMDDDDRAIDEPGDEPIVRDSSVDHPHQNGRSADESRTSRGTSYP